MQSNTVPSTTASPEVLMHALAEARLMLLQMGHVIRYLDEDNEHYELWSNDGAYVPDKRFRLIDGLVPMALKSDLQSEAPEAHKEAGMPAEPAEPESGTAFVVVQQGGSSLEVYIHASSTRQEAEAFREECENGAYETSEIIEVPGALAAHGESLYEVLEAVAEAAIALP